MFIRFLKKPIQMSHSQEVFDYKYIHVLKDGEKQQTNMLTDKLESF